MNLQDTVKVNRQILKLIKSKYEEFFPGAYTNRDTHYYRSLEKDTIQAEEALKHGGLALPPGDFAEAGEQ